MTPRGDELRASGIGKPLSPPLEAMTRWHGASPRHGARVREQVINNHKTGGVRVCFVFRLLPGAVEFVSAELFTTWRV